MSIVKEDIISKILSAESEYHAALGETGQRAETYEETARADHGARVAELMGQWQAYEKGSNEKFEALLLEQSRRLEDELRRRKEALRARQQSVAGAIAERLKGEVLSQYGDC